MAGAASAHQAATASREQNSQQRAGRTRRTSADPQRAQQGATAAAADAPAALQTLSRLQHLADASPQVAQLRRLQALADGRFAPVAQLAGDPEEEVLVQGKFATAQRQPQLQQAPRANNTGLPDQLKRGIESLTGLSMDHVRVHYNSSHPAQLNALAYAQGSDIHLAPGQERHLPHEAWHVVQQAQGRVRPTLQLKDGVPVNDDPGLEREADVMGSKALEGRYRVVDGHHSISVPIETAQSIDRDATNSLGVNVANNDSAPLANGRGSAQRGGNEMQRIADHRPEAALQRQVQAWGDGSERVGQLRTWQGVADGRGVEVNNQHLTAGFQKNFVQPAQLNAPAFNTVQRVTNLLVQQGPSCWLYVLEAVVKSKGLDTRYISMVMKSYPESPEAIAKQKEEEESGNSISKRAAALGLIAENITEMIAKLYNWKIGEGGKRSTRRISKKIVERYAKQTLSSDRSVEHLTFESDAADVDGIIIEYTKAKTRARALAMITIEERDDVASLLNTGPQIIDKDQDPDDVHLGLKTQDKPSYVSIRARFIPTKDELNADSGAVDLSNRDFAELKKTAHAILLDEYDEETKIVTYKDPNYGDLKLQVTHLQFQAMAGDDKVKLRPFFRDGFGKSRLAEVV